MPTPPKQSAPAANRLLARALPVVRLTRLAPGDAYLASNAVAAGMTLHFQVWSRDPGCATPDNIGMSGALRVLICA